jgi:DNA-binding GntR family transcriptional regulator
VIGLEGVSGLTTRVDSMGGEFSCRSRQVTWRSPPEDVSWALQLPADQQVCMVRLAWTVGREPAALCTTYLPGDIAGRMDVGAATGLPATLNPLQAATVVGVSPQTRPRATTAGPSQADSPAAESLVGSPAALHIELLAPPPSVARSLRLVAGQPALVITVKFAEPGTDRPVALTVAALRPDLFRVIVRTGEPLLAGQDTDRPPGSWVHAVDGWES